MLTEVVCLFVCFFYSAERPGKGRKFILQAATDYDKNSGAWHGEATT